MSSELTISFAAGEFGTCPPHEKAPGALGSSWEKKPAKAGYKLRT